MHDKAFKANFERKNADDKKECNITQHARVNVKKMQVKIES